MGQAMSMNHKRFLYQLALIAGLSSFIYWLVFTLPYPLSRLYATIPPVDYAKLTSHSAVGCVVYIVSVLVLFGLYGWAFHLTVPAASGGRTAAVGGRFILFSSAILAAVSIPAYPLTAIDMFSYAIHTRGWALYGLNPLATAPAALPSYDPWLGLAGEWGDAPSPYGPVWEWLSLAAYHLSGGTFLAHLLALKVLTALAYLGCVGLLYQILRRIRPEWAVAGTLAFAWNPLVLLESVQNGHNDIVMAFFLLAALGVMARSTDKAVSKPPTLVQVALASLLLAVSILVKFMTVLVVPFFELALAMSPVHWQRRLGMVGLSVFLIGATVALGMLPLWPGLENWAVLTGGQQTGRSLLTLMILGLRDWIGLNQAFDLSRTLLLLAFLLIYLHDFWTTCRQAQNSPTYVQVCSPAFYTLFWFVLIVAPIFHAWYLLWFVPLMPLLLPDRRPWRVSTVFSLTALLIIPYFETVRAWYPALLHNQLLGHLIGIPLLIGPPLLAMFWPIKHPVDVTV